MPTKIEWADETWNPIVGCKKCSPGCQHCYAEGMSYRLAAMGMREYQEVMTGKRFNGEVRFVHGAINKPGEWRKPKRVFPCSMSDLFNPAVPWNWQYEVYKRMAEFRQHQYMVVTKRPEVAVAAVRELYFHLGRNGYEVPLKNVQHNLTVCTQDEAERKIPVFLELPGEKALSLEPLLGPIRMTKLQDEEVGAYWNALEMGISEVKVGGETGSGARPMHPDWVRLIRDDCIAAGVGFFFKHWGEWLHQNMVTDRRAVLTPFKFENGHVGSFMRVGRKNAGRLLDGREWNGERGE
jgi:protein gp37